MAVSTEEDPVVQGRRLRVELRSLRKESGRTQQEVAAELDWSASKLVRIENGGVRIAPSDVRVLLSSYGVTDKGRIDRLVAMARSARQDRWAEYRDLHSHAWLSYLSYESSAVFIRNYEVLYVPGLLQTEEYAMATYRNDGIELTRSQRLWEARLRRQELHDSATPPQMSFTLDEMVVRRATGGAGVMHKQLLRLRELSDLAHVTLQVIPFAVGAYPWMARPFVLLEFSDPKDDDLLYLEDERGGTTTRDDPELTAEYTDAFYKQQELALSPRDTQQFLDDLIERGADAPVTTAREATS
jgi:transcriptional regulator with XRE-family HTH domain